MLMTHSQETCTRNLCKFTVQVSCIRFWCKFMQVCTRETFTTNTADQTDLSIMVTCVQVSGASRLVQDSCARLLSVCHRHYRFTISCAYYISNTPTLISCWKFVPAVQLLQWCPPWSCRVFLAETRTVDTRLQRTVRTRKTAKAPRVMSADIQKVNKWTQKVCVSNRHAYKHCRCQGVEVVANPWECISITIITVRQPCYAEPCISYDRVVRLSVCLSVTRRR